MKFIVYVCRDQFHRETEIVRQYNKLDDRLKRISKVLIKM